MPKTIKAIQEGQQPNLFENWATTSFRVSLLNSSMGRVWGRCGGLVVPKGSGPKGECGIGNLFASFLFQPIVLFF